MMTDPISDMLTRIRNGQSADKISVNIPGSKVKAAIAQVLKQEGYIEDYEATQVEGKPVLEVKLKYYQGEPVISELRRVSRPGLRVYKRADGKAYAGHCPRCLAHLVVAIGRGGTSKRFFRAR